MSSTLMQFEKKIWTSLNIKDVAMDFSKPKKRIYDFYGTSISIALTNLCCITKFFVVYYENWGRFYQVSTKNCYKYLKSGITAY